jgi:hypothetical protein
MVIGVDAHKKSVSFESRTTERSGPRHRFVADAVGLLLLIR